VSYGWLLSAESAASRLHCLIRSFNRCKRIFSRFLRSRGCSRSEPHCGFASDWLARHAVQPAGFSLRLRASRSGSQRLGSVRQLAGGSPPGDLPLGWRGAQSAAAARLFVAGSALPPGFLQLFGSAGTAAQIICRVPRCSHSSAAAHPRLLQLSEFSSVYPITIDDGKMSPVGDRHFSFSPAGASRVLLFLEGGA